MDWEADGKAVMLRVRYSFEATQNGFVSSMKGVLLIHPPLTPLSQIPFTPGIVGFPGK